MRRVLLVVAVALVGLMGAVTIALGGEVGQLSPFTPPPPPATVAFGATEDVSPGAPATVTVTSGVLDQVSLATEDGEPVKGTLSADRLSWSSSEPLDYGATYTWSGSATGADGSKTPVQGSFTTVDPDLLVGGKFNIGDGDKVGVAAPVIVTFDEVVEDKAAVEKALTITTTPAVEGSWGWMDDTDRGSAVHWRPKEYWPANTEVSVTAKLYGTAAGDGLFGQEDISSTFTVGRNQVVKADATTFRMKIYRDGELVEDYPTSMGRADQEATTTRSGTHVVTEVNATERLTSSQFGYDVEVPWAVRISANGEFIHTYDATAGDQGQRNVSHGCLNLTSERAKAYYDTALYGDPVEIVGTDVPLSAADGDIWDWTVTWEEWQELSAL